VNTIKTLEQELDRLRQELNIPGMSVAVLHKQQVVLARGFGYADIENKMPAVFPSVVSPAAATVAKL